MIIDIDLNLSSRYFIFLLVQSVVFIFLSSALFWINWVFLGLPFVSFVELLALTIYLKILS